MALDYRPGLGGLKQVYGQLYREGSTCLGLAYILQNVSGSKPGQSDLGEGVFLANLPPHYLDKHVG